MSRERRSAPRIQLFGKLHGRLVALDVPVTVLEISLGGLTLETAIDFPMGAVQEFRLQLGDDSTVFVKGRVMHCRRAASTDRSPLYNVGIQFLDDDAADSDPISDLIDRIS